MPAVIYFQQTKTHMLIVEDGVAAGAFEDLLGGKGSVAAWNDAPT